MSLTRSQLHERISDLSGMYKAAQENKRLASQKRAEDERFADLSRQADEKADGHLIDVAAQIREAQQEYSAAVEELIAVPGAPIASEDGPEPEMIVAHGIDPWTEGKGTPFNNIFTEGADFQAEALQNGLSRIEDAFNRSTQ
jgi:hypothetical protein